MNEITIHGNLTAEPVLRHGQSGKYFVTFTVAVNRSYYAQERGARVEMPAVFHDVIAYNQLAENAAESLHKGTTVTVTGLLADNSFTPGGSGQVVRRQRLEAYDVAASLRFATARVAKRSPSPRPAPAATGAGEPSGAGAGEPVGAATSAA